MKQEDKLLNPRQAAEILGVSTRTIYQWSWLKKHLPFVKVGGSIRVSEGDLLAFIARRKSHPCKS